MENPTEATTNTQQPRQKPLIEKIVKWITWLYIPVFLACDIPLRLLKKTDAANSLLMWFGAGTIIISLSLVIFIIGTVVAKKYKKYSLNGLTGIFLVYMLIFGAIIGAPRGSTDKARDAQRKSDIAQLQTALSRYYDDYSTYPVMQANGGIGPDSSANLSHVGTTTNSIFDENGSLVQRYLAQAVFSPTENSEGGNTDNDQDHYFYLTPIDDAPTSYILFTQLEENNNKYYYAINNEGTIWDYENKKTDRPTCIVGRSPVCGY